MNSTLKNSVFVSLNHSFCVCFLVHLFSWYQILIFPRIHEILGFLWRAFWLEKGGVSGLCNETETHQTHLIRDD